jgi:branched-chain amino acid transport system permease protein
MARSHLAIFQTGKVPGTVWLLLMMAVLAALMELSVSAGSTPRNARAAP